MRTCAGHDAEQSRTIGTEDAADSKGRVLPRQMIRIQRTEPEENVVRTELRFVIYQSRKDLEEKALFELVAKRVQTIEKSATSIAPEFAAFQTQLATLLTDLEERKRAGGSPDAAFYNDQVIRQKLEQLQQFAATTAHEYMNYEVQQNGLQAD
uniref:Uncharacterized protein n=1 Tax=Brugia malayi TaxID=6279 RepID=A0A5S6PFM8_BRUMA